MNIIDISHILNEDTPLYPGDHAIWLREYATLEKNNYVSYVLTAGMHTGTHVDIPMHLVRDDRRVSDFPPVSFLGKGVLLDVRGQNPILMKDCYRKTVQEGDIVLLYTGFDEFYMDTKYFTEYPVVSGELGGFLISRKIKMLGMDTPAPDYAPFVLHKRLLEKGIFLLENLTNLQSLVGIDDFEVIALPLKIQAEASLVRAVCRC